MDVVEELARRGGLSDRATLVHCSSRVEVDAALAAGRVVAVGHGRYALPSVEEAPRVAHALSGVIGLESAALHHGWEIKNVPDLPHVLVSRHRKIAPDRRRGAQVHWIDAPADQVTDGVTDHELTLLHCARMLPFDAALAVFDSALRHDVPPATIRRVGLIAAGTGAAKVRRVAALADGRAANPFESVLRAIAADVAGLGVRPQVRIQTRLCGVRVDLADEDLRLVLEADSFEWHGSRPALRRDCRRYDVLVAAGWRVLRFAWEDVMHDQDFVRQVLIDVVAVAGGLAEVRLRR